MTRNEVARQHFADGCVYSVVESCTNRGCRQRHGETCPRGVPVLRYEWGGHHHLSQFADEDTDES